MTRENPYGVPALHAKSVTFTDVTTFNLGITGIQFDQNGGINSLSFHLYPDGALSATNGVSCGNVGFNGKLLFYYDGPQLISSNKISIGTTTFNYAYWADIGHSGLYCNTGGGLVVSFMKPLDAQWNVGARIVPRDSWATNDTNIGTVGRHSQKLFCTLQYQDPETLWTVAKVKGHIQVGTAGLPDPKNKFQPGRLWGIGDGTFANGSLYASGATGITFPQEGGIHWMQACLRPNYASGGAPQTGNIKIDGNVKFFYDGPVVSSTGTVSVTVDGVAQTFNYAYEKDVPITMYCVTNPGRWELRDAKDFNRMFDPPMKIVDRENHSGGAQRIHVRVDFDDPWDSESGKVNFGLGFATVNYDPYNNFKAS